jgi:branched-chain amino acid transport system ATP-binding protein
MLELDGVQAWYGKTQALFDVSFVLDEGQCLALVGANGAGKTTTIRSILGLIQTRGRIRCDGHSLEGVLTHERVRRHAVAVVPEGRGLFSRLTVRENLVAGLSRRRLDGVDEALDLFPLLRNRLNENVMNLSGGQQQMVALARAMAKRPRLLLLDEPSLGLAPVIVDEIYSFLDRMRETGITMLLVDQSIVRARDFSDQLCLIKTGTSMMTVSADDHEAVERLSRAAFEEGRVAPELMAG